VTTVRPVLGAHPTSATLAPPRPASQVGESAPRPDGVPKVTGVFAFSSDLHADAMLWGRTLRSPHPHARLVSLDISEALRIAGVLAVLTAEDVPGRNTYGLTLPDQPVLAHDIVRYEGEPVAAVAADHPETAQQAPAALVADYEPLPAVTDPDPAAPAAPIPPAGNAIRSAPRASRSPSWPPPSPRPPSRRSPPSWPNTSPHRRGPTRIGPPRRRPSIPTAT